MLKLTAVPSFKPSNLSIPVMWPGVITTGLFSFLLAYNDFAVTSMLLSEDNRTMVPKNYGLAWVPPTLKAM